MNIIKIDVSGQEPMMMMDYEDIHIYRQPGGCLELSKEEQIDPLEDCNRDHGDFIHICDPEKLLPVLQQFLLDNPARF